MHAGKRKQKKRAQRQKALKRGRPKAKRHRIYKHSENGTQLFELDDNDNVIREVKNDKGQ